MPYYQSKEFAGVSLAGEDHFLEIFTQRTKTDVKGRGVVKMENLMEAVAGIQVEAQGRGIVCQSY